MAAVNLPGPSRLRRVFASVTNEGSSTPAFERETAEIKPSPTVKERPALATIKVKLEPVRSNNFDCALTIGLEVLSPGRKRPFIVFGPVLH